MQERAAERCDSQRGGEQCESLEALAALALPIHIARVEPQCELIQGERRTDAIGHRHRTASPRSGATRARADLQQPSVSCYEQQQDAPDEVMNVAATHLNIVERADLVMNEERQRPNHRYGNEETKGSPEEPLARRLGEFLTVDRGQGAGSEESADAE